MKWRSFRLFYLRLALATGVSAHQAEQGLPVQAKAAPLEGLEVLAATERRNLRKETTTTTTTGATAAAAAAAERTDPPVLEFQGDQPCPAPVAPGGPLAGAERLRQGQQPASRRTLERDAVQPRLPTNLRRALLLQPQSVFCLTLICCHVQLLWVMIMVPVRDPVQWSPKGLAEIKHVVYLSHIHVSVSKIGHPEKGRWFLANTNITETKGAVELNRNLDAAFARPPKYGGGGGYRACLNQCRPKLQSPERGNRAQRKRWTFFWGFWACL